MEVSTAGLITQSEYDKLKLYTDDSMEVEKIKGCYGSLKNKEKREIIVKLANHCLLSAFLCGAGGGLIGGTLGSVGGFLCANVPGMAPGGWVGVKLGGAVGFIGGLFKSGYEFKIEFLASPEYNNWIKTMNEENLAPIFLKIFQNDDRFENFTCPLTHDLISVPVKAPDGKIYEQANIVEWLTKKYAEIQRAKDRGDSKEKISQISETISPIRGIPYTIADLKYEKEYFSRLAPIIKQKLSELEDTEVKRLFEIGTQILKETHQENRKMILEHQIGKINMLVLENKIPRRVADEACWQLKQQYA